MQLADSHCHLPLVGAQLPVPAVIAAAAEQGVDYMLCVAIDLESHAPIVSLAAQHGGVAASAGVHPNSNPGQALDLEMLRAQAAADSVVAIGETGLDYFRSDGDLEWQRERFRWHIRLAKDCGKPLIIHCREAKQDVIRILREEGAQEVGGVMHCFVEDLETARQAMALNFRISLSGIVTFKNAGALQEVARRLPLEHLLIETDSPYLAPVPHRGETNQPAYVRHVAEKVAALQSIPVERVAEQTTANYLAMVGLDASP